VFAGGVAAAEAFRLRLVDRLVPAFLEKRPPAGPDSSGELATGAIPYGDPPHD
jgi:hypothetical protein